MRAMSPEITLAKGTTRIYIFYCGTDNFDSNCSTIRAFSSRVPSLCQGQRMEPRLDFGGFRWMPRTSTPLQ